MCNYSPHAGLLFVALVMRVLYDSNEKQSRTDSSGECSMLFHEKGLMMDQLAPFHFSVCEMCVLC